MAERRMIHERVSGLRMQNQDVWCPVREDDGRAVVIHERLCREEGEKAFRRVEERCTSVGEATSQGGKLAGILGYAIPH
jgi:hypothetical protein